MYKRELTNLRINKDSKESIIFQSFQYNARFPFVPTILKSNIIMIDEN